MTGDASLTPKALAIGTAVYRVCLTLALIPLAVALTFFAIGLGDGTVSSVNLLQWLALLGVLGGLAAAGHALRRRGHTRRAIAVLSVIALPALFGGLLVLLAVVLQPRWN